MNSSRYVCTTVYILSKWLLLAEVFLAIFWRHSYNAANITLDIY